MAGYGRVGDVRSPGPRWDPTIRPKKIGAGTVRRVLSFARPYRAALGLLVTATALDALLTVVNPMLTRHLINDGVLPRREPVVLTVALAMAGIAIADCLLGISMRWYSARIGQSLTYDLRTRVFEHVLRQPIAFFTRAQTGSLVSRLNTDVVGAQSAVTSVLSSAVSNVLSLVAMLCAICYLSWVVGAVAVGLIPVLFVPAVVLGTRLRRLTRESMQLDAELGATMTERFNVGGALLVKLFGRPGEDAALFAGRAAKLRDVGVLMTMYGQSFAIALLLASLAATAVYGVGGTMIVHGTLQLGSLVALTTLVVRLYGPVSGLTNVPMNLLMALVSFERVFEVLDLEPLVADAPDVGMIVRTARVAPCRMRPSPPTTTEASRHERGAGGRGGSRV